MSTSLCDGLCSAFPYDFHRQVADGLVVVVSIFHQFRPLSEEETENGAAYTEDEGRTWIPVSADSLVSMNMWGVSSSMLQMLEEKFPDFLEENLKTNPLKCEFFLPFVVDELLEEKRATVQVLKTEDQWHGVTYQEDKKTVVDAIQKLKRKGLYPEQLWG